MPYTITQGPTVEPITLTEAKAHLKISYSTEDDLIEALITSAREWAEQETGRAFGSRTVMEYFDCWPGCGIELQKTPVRAVSGVGYLPDDDSGVYAILDTTAYFTDIVSEPSRIWYNNDDSLPSIDTDRPNAVRVEYEAGYASASDMPTGAKQAMLLMIGFWYENREDMPVNETNNPRVRSATALIRNYKVFV